MNPQEVGAATTVHVAPLFMTWDVMPTLVQSMLIHTRQHTHLM